MYLALPGKLMLDQRTNTLKPFQEAQISQTVDVLNL